MKVHADTSVVFVLGRGTRLDARAIEGSAGNATSVLVLSVGYPVSGAQHRALDAALELARREEVTVDAVLVTSAADLPELVGHADRVVIAGSRGERRRFARALARV